MITDEPGACGPFAPHFDQLCRSLEQGFAIHTGSSDRLIIEYGMREAKSDNLLPRITAKPGVSFRISQSCVKPSEFFLSFEPDSEVASVELATLDPITNTLELHEFSSLDLADEFGVDCFLPVIKLASLRGLHFIKESIYLQLFQLDYELLERADKQLATQVQEAVQNKFAHYIQSSNAWLNASHAEQAALEYLEQNSLGNA